MATAMSDEQMRKLAQEAGKAVAYLRKNAAIIRRSGNLIEINTAIADIEMQRAVFDGTDLTKYGLRAQRVNTIRQRRPI